MNIMQFFWATFISFFFLTSFVRAQDSMKMPIKSFPNKIASFATNMTGELYLIGEDNNLKKYDSNGDSVGVFNNVRQFGKLSYIKVDNPWRVLLFYQGFQTIVLLDKYLKFQGKISLRDLGSNGVMAIAPSYDNKIWYFDRNDYKIKKVDENGNLVMSSDDFRQLFDPAPNPDWMMDSDGALYLYDPEKGLYIFDYYTAFKDFLPFKNWKWLDVIKKEVIGFDDMNIYVYENLSSEAIDTPLPLYLRNADQIDVTLKNVYYLKNGNLSVFDR